MPLPGVDEDSRMSLPIARRAPEGAPEKKKCAGLLWVGRWGVLISPLGQQLAHCVIESRLLYL